MPGSVSGLQTSYLVYGSGESSALAPTVVVLDAAAARALAEGASVVTVPRRAESFLGGSFLGGSDVSGGGFGSSSTTWSGWSFTWSGWGSPIYSSLGAFSTYGAEHARVSAR